MIIGVSLSLVLWRIFTGYYPVDSIPCNPLYMVFREWHLVNGIHRNQLDSIQWIPGPEEASFENEKAHLKLELHLQVIT